MNRTTGLATLVLIGVVSLAAAGARSQTQSPDPKVLELQKLKDNLYLLSGGGGNTAVFVTDLGVVLVDTKLAGWGQPILDKIKTITTKPVTTIINTHAHDDHVGSNEFFPTSVEIVAQENTRLNMDRLDAFKGVKVNFLPKLMFKDKMSLGSGKDRIDLYYFGPGHTGGDAWVVFPTQRVMHAGDMILPRQAPIIDFDHGGSGLAYPDTLAKAAASVKNVDAIIPGHGPLVTPKDLEEYGRFTRDFRDAVVSGFNHGLGISEVAESWRLPEKYRGYTAPPERVKANVLAIFAGLTRP
jgi:glyoxylase-like metal-dependent hydrolase (beta-lactamase superfamily II)